MDLVDWRCFFCIEADEYRNHFPKKIRYHGEPTLEDEVFNMLQEESILAGEVFRLWKRSFAKRCTPEPYYVICIAQLSNMVAIQRNFGYEFNEATMSHNWSDLEAEHYG